MSNRIAPVDSGTAEGKSRELLDGIQRALGKTPNIFKAMANSPAVLQAYLGFSGALKAGALEAKLREQIALAVGQENDCRYCLAAHTALGKGAGLQDREIEAARRGQGSDPKTAAALRFAVLVVKNRGNVSDAEIGALRKAGFGDGDIAEIVANVALNIFTNYFNHVADPVVDFPAAQPLAATARDID
jgi:uncharacterized peroxidase-related enzyme